MKIGNRTLKTAIGTGISMLIAQFLGLKFYASAGIITILSIQNTKRKSFKVALQRIGACIIGLLISGILMELLGFNPVVFALFMLIFIPVAVKLNISEGIVMSSVLATHFLGEGAITKELIINELGLIAIGVGVALLLNLYMKNMEEYIIRDKIYIEDALKDIFIDMSRALRELSVSLQEDKKFNDLEKKLYAAKKKAYINLNNYFMSDESYYLEYMEMRIKQFKCVKRMRSHFEKFFMTYEQTEMIADFTKKVGENLAEQNSCEMLLKDLKELREKFKESELPTTREEFENRAMLYQFLNDLEQFLEIKNEFYYEQL
ncbi:aromatic acid exporter family protein [Clostridium senegalense]|uniref:Aromatic acid exporter family protein n=1 Tax=Clostridium senegalense TaxID=1465809 RepID=A0A6M0H1N0_9CLOT|nr:aromatic acid exporter family protein [Clostridium senegalense]NEU04675.1 aromatic acid exporter family protein [Clostridium senegalense]